MAAPLLVLVLMLISAICCDPVRVEVLVHQTANVTLNFTEEVSTVISITNYY